MALCAALWGSTLTLEVIHDEGDVHMTSLLTLETHFEWYVYH